MTESVVRFLVGGAVVSVFALVGDSLRPRTFAGLFGAAPSIALATLALSYAAKGGDYVALEGRSMILGGVAMTIYAVVSVYVIRRQRLSPWLGLVALWGAWCIPAFLLKAAFAPHP